MVYYGRSFDTFESAIAMLNNGVPICNHIDSLSGRAFALKREPSNAMYSCVLTIEEAVDNLNKIIGNVFLTADPSDLHEPFVMELQNDIGIPTVFRKYYSHGHYIFCFRKDNTICIHDPDGFHYLSYPSETFYFGKQKVIVQSGVKPSADIDADNVLKKGKTLLRSAIHSGDSFTHINRVFLQYAIRNYVCQTNKILAFLCSYTSVPEIIQSKIENLFSQLLSTVKLSYDEISAVDEQVCDLLDGLLC
jgi:hypothetical protein